jgi:hypothetical protein
MFFRGGGLEGKGIVHLMEKRMVAAYIFERTQSR